MPLKTSQWYNAMRRGKHSLVIDKLKKKLWGPVSVTAEKMLRKKVGGSNNIVVFWVESVRLRWSLITSRQYLLSVSRNNINTFTLSHLLTHKWSKLHYFYLNIFTFQMLKIITDFVFPQPRLIWSLVLIEGGVKSLLSVLFDHVCDLAWDTWFAVARWSTQQILIWSYCTMSVDLALLCAQHTPASL